jgi:peptidoglycan/xylan/chitin deacetylase (PgdA/CDA1 family)/lysophospholipase L1-like esterase
MSTQKQSKKLSTIVKMIVCIVLFSPITVSFAQTKTFIAASDSNIRISGRTDKSDPNNVVFAFSGVSIKAKFEGTSIDAFLTEYGSGSATTTNYFNVIIDGGTPTVLKLTSAQSVYTLASGLTQGVHTVELFKRTESNVGKVAFKGFKIDDGKKLVSPDALPTRKIEFIGNSITCGYGNELTTTTPDNYHFTSVNENNYKAWGAVTARSLNAQYSCVAFSGRGLYQNNTGSKVGTLPIIYDQIIADDASTAWNHYNYIPDVVVINLGTNDFSAEVASASYKVDSATFVKTYVDFITKLRGYYPNASFICCVGTMMSDYYPIGGKHWTRIQNYVSSVRTYFTTHGDSKVFYLKLEPQNSPYGEDWHPTAVTDKIMADTLTHFINKNIQWDACPGSVELGSDINLKYTSTPIILNSHSNTNNGVSYSWYKNGTVLSSEILPSVQISDTIGATGVYKVVRDSANCKYEDDIKLTNTLRKPGTICRWLDNKSASVVLTFDDWSPGHPAIVVPELKKRNMNGTFFVIGGNVSNWSPILNAAKDGNEIGNHTKTHPDITKLTTVQLDAEVKYTDSVINKNIPIQKVSTFDYPFGAFNATVINYLKKINYLGARGVWPSSSNYTYNFAPTINDYFNAYTVAMTSNFSIATYGGELKNIISGGGMLTVLYHSVNSPTVTDNNYAMVAQSDFQRQLDTIQSLRSKVWVTTYANALKYHREARCASLVEIESPTSNKWVVNLTDTITDSVLYNHPLSIILRLNGKKYDVIKQAGTLLKIDSVFNDTILFKALPNKGPITLSVSGINVKSIISPLQCVNTNKTTVQVNVEATSSVGIKEVIANLSTIGGDTTTVLTKTTINNFAVSSEIPAATATGYKKIEISVTDSSGNVHIEQIGITITNGIVVGAINVYQTADSIWFSVSATDDSQIASVTANLTSVKGAYVTTLKKMNADTFYVSVPRQLVTIGSKLITIFITDNTGNVVPVYKAFTVNSLTAISIHTNDLQLFPNPANSSITIDSKYEISEVEICNSLGTEYLHLTNKTEMSNTIDISFLPNGFYVVLVHTDSGLIEKPFVVIR